MISTLEEAICGFKASVLKRLRAVCFADALGAAGSIIVSVIALSGVFPTRLAALASVILGAALLLEATGLASCFVEVWRTNKGEGELLEWGGATFGKLLGGLCGILIGTLVIFGVASPALLPLGVLIYGAAFLFTSMTSSVPGTQELAGAIAFFLGLLAIVGLHPLTFVLAALLVFGITTLVNDATSERRMQLQITAGRV
jgi:hypothetical protein